MKLLGARVLVEEEPAKEQTAGGIILPEKNKEKSCTGKVIAVGPGIRDNKGNLHPVNVSVGDKVMYTQFAGATIKVDDKEYVIINERDILVVLDV